MAGVPANWQDDGTTLTAPHGHKVVKGFRDYVLSHEWDPGNEPIEEEHPQNPLEYNSPGIGAGTQQMFNLTVLEYDEARGVQLMYVGKELLYLRALVNQYRATQVATDYAEIIQLKAQLQLQLGKLQQIVKVATS